MNHLKIGQRLTIWNSRHVWISDPHCNWSGFMNDVWKLDLLQTWKVFNILILNIWIHIVFHCVWLCYLGFLASWGSLYLTTTPLTVFVSSNNFPDRPKLTPSSFSDGFGAKFSAANSLFFPPARLFRRAASAAAFLDSALCLRLSRRTEPLDELVTL